LDLIIENMCNINTICCQLAKYVLRRRNRSDFSNESKPQSVSNKEQKKQDQALIVRFLEQALGA